jgi:DNA-binding SARP family transcriptional activator
MRAFSWAARSLTRVAAGLALITLVAGVPAGLAFGLGWPLPTSIPTTQAGWEQLLSAPIPDTAILRLLGIAGWLLWAAFVRSAWIEARAAWHGIHAPARSIRFNPLRGLAALIITTLAIGGLTAGAATALPAAAATPASPVPAVAALHPTLTSIVLPPAGTATSAHRAPLLPAGPAVLVIDACPHLYQVHQGDSLWHIAGKCLGDPTRWEEIWDLNHNRFWPEVSGFTTFDKPDLIYPRWTLTLPDGATAPPDAQPAEPPSTSPAGAPTVGASPTPQVSTPAPDATGPDDGAIGPAVPSTPATARPTPSGPATPTPAPSATTTTPASTTPTAQPGPTATAAADEHGVHLDNGSWLPWSVVGAVIAAMAVACLQRRRRYLPRPMNGTAADARTEPAGPPPTLRRLQHAWRIRPGAPARDAATNDVPAITPPATPTPRIAPMVAVPPVPPMDPLPVGGLGITGAGAEAAARGAMVAALAAGAPTDPDAHTTVIIPVDTMMTLLGADAVELGIWHRLRVTPDLDTALTLLEKRLLYAARILDDYNVTDIAALRATAPSEQALPPMLLIADTPPDGIRVRTRMVLGLGTGIDVSALLLGTWDHGPTVTVDTDGTCHRRPGHDGDIPSRLPVLDPTAAVELLQTVREAHTGEPTAPAASDPTPPPRMIEGPNDEKATTAPDNGDSEGPADEVPAPGNAKRATSAPKDGDASSTATPEGVNSVPRPLAEPDPSDHASPSVPLSPPHDPVRARVLVLGQPHIVDQPADQLVRTSSIELMVYLAVHADGAHPDQIAEDIWMGVRPRLAQNRLHTAVSNLRKLLAGSAPDVAAQVGDFVVKQHGRYRLNPDLVDIDLWRLRAAHTHARTAGSDPARLVALHDVCDLYTGPLAADEGYEWIERHRQGVLNLAIDAHTALATALADTDPVQAVQLLQAAADHDPANEQVAQQFMHAQHRLGDPDAIRAVLRRLALALDEIGTEPSVETTDLAEQLRRDLIRRTR